MLESRGLPRDRLNELKSEWGKWLEEWSWEWFVTATFRDTVGLEQADARWRKWIKEIEKAVSGEVGWVRVREYQRYRGSIPHFHALVLGVGDTRRMAWLDRWYQVSGLCRVYPYDKALGARFYLGKYLVKELGDLTFSGNLERMRGYPEQLRLVSR